MSVVYEIVLPDDQGKMMVEKDDAGKVIVKRVATRGHVVNRIEHYDRIDATGRVHLEPLTEEVAKLILNRVYEGENYSAAFIIEDKPGGMIQVNMTKSPAEHKFTSTGIKFWRHQEQMSSYLNQPGHSVISTHISPEGACNLKCPYCLVSDTYIDTTEGKKRIRDITLDDVLVIGNQAVGVEKTISRWADGLSELKLEDGTTIYATGEHPFFTERGWVWLRELKLTDRLCRIQAADKALGLLSPHVHWSWNEDQLFIRDDADSDRRPVGRITWCQISSILPAEGNHQVWNLTCKGGAFVANGVLVHNCSVTYRDTHSRIELDVVQRYVTNLMTRGLKAVILTGGGEPTIYPHFNELVSWIKAQGLKVALITNGTQAAKVKVWDAFSWVRVSLNVFDGWTEKISVPVDQLSPEAILGCSMVYTAEHEASAKDGVTSRLEMLRQAAKVADRLKAKYVRLLPNCLLAQRSLLVQHKALDLDIHELGDARFFHQHKVHGAPKSHTCHQAYFRPYLSEEKFHGNGKPGTVYPCDSVVLNNAVQHFAVQYQLCHADDILDFLDGKLAQQFNPKEHCQGCVFTDNVNMLDDWKHKGLSQFDQWKDPLLHEEFV